MTDQFGTDAGNDYTPDQVPSFPGELKGNSAEGNPLGEVGLGLHAAPARQHAGDEGMEGREEGKDALGAFIQGHGPADSETSEK